MTVNHHTGQTQHPDPIEDREGDPDWYGYCLDDLVNGHDPLGLFANLIGTFLQYAPAINELGKAASEDIADGKPGILSIPGWYADTVKDNVKYMKKERNKYYENLYKEKKETMPTPKDKTGITTPEPDEATEPSGTPPDSNWWGR